MNSYQATIIFARKTGDRRVWRIGTYSEAIGETEHKIRRRLLEWYLKKNYQVKSIKVEKW